MHILINLLVGLIIFYQHIENNSMQQLAEITNENSASTEEMSASAEELSAQAKQLKKMISVFQIRNLKNENQEY